MKNIKEKFNQIQKDNPMWSSYICFCRTIDSKYLMSRDIKKLFNKLVDKSDYLRSEKDAVLEYLCKMYNFRPRKLRI